MRVGLAVLTEIKLVDNRHPKTVSGYSIMYSKALSGHQGGVALMWKENDPKFEVESVLFNNGPNIATFQLTTGDERFYVIGIYVPPNCSKGVDDLRNAWDACPLGCKPIVLGDLNIYFGFPRDEREEVIVDLLDEINFIDMSRRFPLRTLRWTTTRARWTWSQKRQGTRYYTQPDYFMARAGDIAHFEGVGFRSPRYLHSDHCAVVANIRVGRTGGLKKYQRARQKFPLSLPPGLKDPNTALFDRLAAKCVNPKPTQAPGKDRMSEGTWKLIKKRASLMRSGKIRQDAARRMQRKVKAALKADKSRLAAEAGERIVSELREGKVQEAFCHLKGWYRNALETQAKPCHQTMERQTNKRVELYAEWAAYGEEFPENGTPFKIEDDPPSEGELRTAVSQLSHGRCRGASGIRAEHIKAWLCGAKKAVDPENGINHAGAGKMWDELVGLCSSVLVTGTIPQQMCWVVTVLIPKGGGEYRGIGLLEPIWKVLEWAMDIWLEKIVLHNSFHVS
jgi:exonuclease III